MTMRLCAPSPDVVVDTGAIGWVVLATAERRAGAVGLIPKRLNTSLEAWMVGTETIVDMPKMAL